MRDVTTLFSLRAVGLGLFRLHGKRLYVMFGSSHDRPIVSIFINVCVTSPILGRKRLRAFKWAILLCVQLQVITTISRTQPEYCILFISKMVLWKNHYIFRPSVSLAIFRSYISFFQGKLYNTYSDVSVSLDRHDYK